MTPILLFAVFFGSMQRHSGRDIFHYSASEMRSHESFMDIREKLDMSHEELREELSNGKSMMEIAKERGITLKLPPRWMNEKGREAFLQRIAERMDMSLEELREELSTGKRLMNIVKERGTTLAFPRSKKRDLTK